MSWFRRKSVKMGVALLLGLGLIVGLAVPSLAAAPPASVTPAVVPKLWTGKVMAIVGTTSFDIQNGSAPVITVNADGSTKYFVVTLPSGAMAIADKLPLAPASRLQLLRRLAKPGTLADLKVGDEVVVPVVPTGSAAKEVLIINVAKPKVDRVRGTITAVTANSISITKADGTVVILKWDAKTHFDLLGLTSVQTGQYTVATYNLDTTVASLVTVRLTPPPTPTATPGSKTK